MSEPVAQFLVYPERPFYWTVQVFRDRGAMRRAFHEINVLDDHDDRFDAIVMPFEKQYFANGAWHSLKWLGYVLFAQTQLGMETQSHEAVHMALGYLRRAKLAKPEETLAYYVGKCASKLNKGFLKHGCYDAHPSRL